VIAGKTQSGASEKSNRQWLTESHRPAKAIVSRFNNPSGRLTVKFHQPFSLSKGKSHFVGPGTRPGIRLVGIYCFSYLTV